MPDNITRLLDFSISNKGSVFERIWTLHTDEIEDLLASKNILIIGAGGSIGKAVAYLCSKIRGAHLDLVDLSENQLAETVRLLRSSSDLKASLNSFCIDYSAPSFSDFLNWRGLHYAYVFNMAAMKHVRSQRDPFTLARMLNLNTIAPVKLFREICANSEAQFVNVSTDKACAPENFMGASKRLMESFVAAAPHSERNRFTRFANVAFSSGSLPESFINRVLHGQPISVPTGIKRYFITQYEASQLCLLALVLAKDNQIISPGMLNETDGVDFVEMVDCWLASQGLTPEYFESLDEACRFQRDRAFKDSQSWPVVLDSTGKTGEKDIETFWEAEDTVVADHREIAVVKSSGNGLAQQLSYEDFESDLGQLAHCKTATLNDYYSLIKKFIPSFRQQNWNINLDQRS